MQTLTYFLAGQGLDGEALEMAMGLFSLKKFQKGDHFLMEGKTAQHLGFIERGLFQYYVLVDGEEKTTYVAGKNSLLGFVGQLFEPKPIQGIPPLYRRCGGMASPKR